jgi:flagellar motor switch protein FliM
MKPERALVAERALAQHCPELVQRGPDPAALLAQFKRFVQRGAEQFSVQLAPLNAGGAISVTTQSPRELGEAELVQVCGQLAANCLFALPQPGVTLLASLEGAAMLRLIDRAFGGRGTVPPVLPATFPLSAELLIGRVEALLAEALATVLGYPEPLRPLRRNSSLTELAPYPAGARLAAVTCQFAEADAAPWSLTLALPLPALAKVFGRGDAPPPIASPRAANPAAAPFAEVPLPLTAVLVEMQVPMSAIAALAPGTVLPVSVARAVPLRVGQRTLARGTVGSQDDRVALQLTSIA